MIAYHERGDVTSSSRVGLARPAAPVEDVVARQVDELRAAPREVGDRADVHRERGVGLALADVEVVERRAVEDDVGRDLLERAIDRGAVGDVELGVR